MIPYQPCDEERQGRAFGSVMPASRARHVFRMFRSAFYYDAEVDAADPDSIMIVPGIYKRCGNMAYSDLHAMTFKDYVDALPTPQCANEYVRGGSEPR